MSKQWMLVAAIIGSLVAGAAVLAEFGPRVARVEIGARAPDFKAAIRYRSGNTTRELSLS
jgi:hypothetical protein